MKHKNRHSLLIAASAIMVTFLALSTPNAMAKYKSGHHSRDWTRIEGRWEHEGDSGIVFEGRIKSKDKSRNQICISDSSNGKTVLLSQVNYFPGIFESPTMTVKVNRFGGTQRITYIEIPKTQSFRYKRFWSVGTLRYSPKYKRLVLRSTKYDARLFSVVPSTRVLVDGTYYPYTAAYEWYGPARITGYILPNGRRIVTEVSMADETDPEAYVPGVGISYVTTPVYTPVVVQKTVVVTKPQPQNDSVTFQYDSNNGVTAQINVKLPLGK